MKLSSYIFIIIGLMILFNFAGLVEGGLIGQLKLTSIEGISALKSFDWFDWFDTQWKELLATSAVLIGTWLATREATTALSAGIASGLLAAFIGDLIKIAVNLHSQGGFIASLTILIFAPLVMGYVITLWDWIRGRD